MPRSCAPDRTLKAEPAPGACGLSCLPSSRYAGVTLSVKSSQFWRNSADCDSVRERVIARIEQRARNVEVLFREVAKPGIVPGSVDRRLASTRPRARAAHASRPRPTTNQKGGCWLIRRDARAPISCRNSCRRKERLRSDQRLGSLDRRRSTVGFESWQGQFQGQFGLYQCSRNSRPVVYLGFSPR